MNPVKDIRKMLEHAFADWVPGTNPTGLYEPIRYIMSLGGKRLRPTLVLTACKMSGSDSERALGPAMAIEIFHNFTLMHDDIMDQAPLRRNQPTVHAKWDVNTAILSGDAMFVKAYEKMMDAPEACLKQVLQVFNKTALQVCEGQQLDMDFESRNDVSLDAYMDMITMKTAVLLAASLQIGALCGGASESDARILYDYGLHTGIAFQLMDDLLDAFGDASSFGKQTGGDILANKKTFLWLSVGEHGSGDDITLLEHWASRHDAPEEKVSAVKSLYQKIGVDKMLKQKVREHYQQADNALTELSFNAEILTTFMEGLMSREV
ncbi:MAG: polyprenyl synthetase family protein [Flavobacteriales bacterium]|nr:polyprenyl synthetase family protein [Flavobacteriales bacterium]